jgi:hypothetical protein
MPRIRVLGGDLAPPRQLYLLFFPGILSFAGIVSWGLSNETGMVVAAATGTLIALFSLWDWVFRHAATRFSTLLGMTLLLGYATGFLNTWLTLPRGSLTVAQVMGLDEHVLARGMGAVLMSSACLYFFGELMEQPVFGRDFRFSVSHKTRVLVYVGTLAVAAGYATHSLGFGGGAGSSGEHVSIFGLFLSWLYPPLTAIAVVAFATSRTLLHRLLTGMSSLALLVMFSVVGRRNSVYTSIEILLLLGLSGFRWKERMLRKVLLILALMGIIVGASLTFMLLRISGGLTPHKKLTVANRIEVARGLVQKGGAYALAAKTTQQNVETRTFVLAFLANVVDASSRMTPALGRDAANLFGAAVPHIILPNKDFPSEEELVDQQFGFSYGDEANSVLTAGATDFGFLGMILYPLIIVWVFKFVLRFLERWLKPVPLMFVVLSFIYFMLQTETTLTGYFEILRDAALFAGGLSIFMSLPAIGERHEP